MGTWEPERLALLIPSAGDARSQLLLLSLGVKGCYPDHPYYYQDACSIKPYITISDLRTNLQQFTSLLVKPIKRFIDKNVNVFKTIVIDSLDKYSSPTIVESSITTILNDVFDIPLKFLV